MDSGHVHFRARERRARFADPHRSELTARAAGPVFGRPQTAVSLANQCLEIGQAPLIAAWAVRVETVSMVVQRTNRVDVFHDEEVSALPIGLLSTANSKNRSDEARCSPRRG